VEEEGSGRRRRRRNNGTRNSILTPLRNLFARFFEVSRIFFGGAKAHTVEFERVRLPSVVRRLRTTDGKRTPSTSVMCAFAPPEKTLRRGLVLSQDSKEEEEEEEEDYRNSPSNSSDFDTLYLERKLTFLLEVKVDILVRIQFPPSTK